MPGSLSPPPPPPPSSSSRPQATTVSAPIASNSTSHSILLIRLPSSVPSRLARRDAAHRRSYGFIAPDTVHGPAPRPQRPQPARQSGRTLRQHPHERDQHASVDHARERVVHVARIHRNELDEERSEEGAADRCEATDDDRR